MISCEKMNEFYSLYIDNELDNKTKQQIEEHLSGCEECRRQLMMLTEMVNTCSSLEEADIPGDFGEKLHERLLEEKQRSYKDNKLLFMNNKYIRAVSSVAAGLLIIIVLKDIWFNLPLQSASKSTRISSENSAAADQSKEVRSGSGDFVRKSGENPEMKNKADEAQAGAKTSPQTDNKGVGDEEKQKAAREDKGQHTQIVDGDSENIKFSEEKKEASQDSQKDSSLEQGSYIYDSSDGQGTTYGGLAAKYDKDVEGDDEADNKATVDFMPANEKRIAGLSAAAAAKDNSAVMRSIDITVRTDVSGGMADNLKSIAANSGGNSSDLSEPTRRADDKSLKALETKVIEIAIPNTEYEKYISSVIAEAGASNITLGELVSEDVSDELNELGKKCEELDCQIACIEASSSVNQKQLDTLKQERALLTASIEKLKTDILNTKITIVIMDK